MTRFPDRHRRLRERIRSRELEDEIQEEFRHHLELRTEENLARGMSPEAARREARRRFGDPARWREEMRRVEMSMRKRRRQRERFESVRREVTQAARGLLRRPGFTFLAVLTLALGIGATTAGFTVLHDVLLAPLPYPEAERLVWLDSPVPRQGPDEVWGLSVAGYFRFREEATSLEHLGAFGLASVSLTREGGALQVRAATVQASLLDALSARPALGRLIEEPDDDPGAEAVVVLGHDLWLREFGGDPSVLGRTVRVEGEPAEVVGVMEPGFRLPRAEVDLWYPVYLDPSEPARNAHWVSAVGKLAEGASVPEAQAELDRITARFPELFPEAYSRSFMEEYGFRTRVRPLAAHVVGPDEARSLWIVAGAVGLVLLIACANVANLLLARTEGRRRELALRSALGAGRGRLLGHAVAESLLLAGAGAVGGVLLAEGALRIFLAVAPPGLPRLSEVAVGWPSLAFAVGVSLAVGLVFGALPMVGRAVRYSALREGARGLTAGRTRHRLRRAIVVAQVALALVLLTGAGLMLRSFHQLRTMDPGFEPRGAVAFELSFRQARYGAPSDAAAFLGELTRRLEALPGVRAAGAGQALPLEGVACAPIQGRNQAPNPGDSPPCTYKQQVSPGYFAALGIELQGRGPSWSALESGEGEAVVTEALARRLWPDEDPLGKGVRGSGSAWYRVVGVTEPLHATALDEPPVAGVFFPLVPVEGAPLWGTVWSPTVIVRTEGPPRLQALAPAIESILRELDPTVPLGTVETLESHVGSSPSMVRRSFMTTLMGVAGALALLLSIVGIYGVISYVVGRRTGEMGVRMALGADGHEVAGLVLRDSLAMAAAGVVVGLLGSLAVTRTLESLLYGVSPVDLPTLGGVAVLLLLLAVAASWVPARRATRVDPVDALRAE